MVNKELFLKMKTLDAELAELDATSAIERVDSLLANETDPQFAFEMKVSKAKLLSSVGRKGDAIDLLKECSIDPVADESAAYFAAEILVEQGRLRESIEALETAQNSMRVAGSVYYRNCIYLLHAYCEFKMGRPDSAGRLLANVSDEEEALFWLNVDPVISVRNLRSWLRVEKPI